jgi:hypothetical protein
MYGLLLTLVLTQAAPASEEAKQAASAVVLVERRVGLSPESAQALAGEVSKLFEREGIPIAVPPEQVDERLKSLGEPSVSACKNQRPCLMKRGQALGATVLLLLKATERKETLTINLEALAVQDGASLWKDLFLMKVGNAEELKAGVVPFAESLRSALSLPAPVPEARPEPVAEARPEPAPEVRPEPDADTPLAPPVTPSPPRLEPPVEPRDDARIALEPQAPAPSGRRSRTLLYAAGGGTLVAVGAAVTFGLMGRGQKSQLDESRFTDASTGREASRLTRTEADRVSGRANLYFNVALSSAVVSALLGTTTGYLWLKDDP